MLIILGGLAGLMLAPSTALATLPASIQTMAGLFAAGPFSLLMGRLGRRTGFLLGGVLAALGGLAATVALVSGNFLLLCAAHFALGAALSCYQYFRFAAAEVVTSEWQPVAISLMLTSGLIAAFAGPQVFIATKDALGAVPLAGAYAAVAGVSIVGVVPLAFVRMPTADIAPRPTNTNRFASLAVLRRKSVRSAVLLAAVSQGVMVFLMVPTPLAMIGCGFSEAMAGDVIRWHVVAMFAPSFFTGFLIKRFGTRRIALTGLALLTVSAMAAATGLSSVHFYGSLILLGVGWNFGFIAATQLLASAVTSDKKSMVQGVNDTVIALASTVFAFAAGAIVAGFGWIVLACIALVILVMTFGTFALERPHPT
ncbi:MFS transporter [Litoreibacter roseus]|uniref:MFS transporter n=2 Tax=Litoreibacter roseus TaxID=2601869 RepID=A0A6N6JEJ9_9RHOB|nr:MFS transporter [Litoreibacter roseus]